MTGNGLAEAEHAPTFESGHGSASYSLQAMPLFQVRAAVFDQRPRAFKKRCHEVAKRYPTIDQLGRVQEAAFGRVGTHALPLGFKKEDASATPFQRRSDGSADHRPVLRRYAFRGIT